MNGTPYVEYLINDKAGSATAQIRVHHNHPRHLRSLLPSKIFKKDRVRISASESPVASASCSLMAPQLRPRRK